MNFGTVHIILTGQFLSAPLPFRLEGMGLVPAKIGEVPVKNTVVYASLAQTLSLGHLKPEVKGTL